MATRGVYFDTDVCKSYGSSITPSYLSFSNVDYNCGSATMYTDAYINFDDESNNNPVFYLQVFLIGSNIRCFTPNDNPINNFLPIKYTVYFYTNTTQSGSPAYTYTYSDPYVETGSYSTWNPNRVFAYNQSRSGEYGTPSQTGNMSSGSSRANFFGGSAGYKAITLPFSGTPFSFYIEVEYCPRSDLGKQYNYWLTGGYSNTYVGYVPSKLTITSPSNVYVNGLNTFSASIASAYTSNITMSLGGYTISNGQYTYFTGIDQPVRNETAPYITSGTATSYIYWNGYLFGSHDYYNFNYTLTVDLTITDPSNSSFKTLVSHTVKTGSASYRNENDLSAYTISLSITDLSGYYSQFGCILRNTNSVIRVAAAVTLRYGAKAQVYLRKFGESTNTQIASLASSNTLTYDQYVPQTGSTAYTQCFIMAGNGTLENVSFSSDIEDYAAPSFTNLAVHRCDADGTANDNGDHVRIEWGVIIAPIDDQNDKILVIDHPEGKTSYNPLSSYIDNGEIIVEASPDYSYTILFTLSDSICNGSDAVVRTIVLSTAGVIMDWLYGGSGVAFGKVAEKQNALEISPIWDLVAYKMMLNDVNVVNWIKEIASRMDAIEQFASNIGSTSQFQVTFYNGSELLLREWVLAGYDATAPSEQPVKESTNTQSFSFVGWALTEGATTADPNALTNIRAYRSIYAAFSVATRYYYVAFYNGGTLLTSFNTIQYHGSPSYSDYASISPTSPTGGTFVGYLPSGRCVEDTVKAMAQFYFDTEIEDTWEEIVAACADGSYKEKYQPGNWKMLDLGTQGNIKMRIKGLNMHRMIGQNKAPITWEADNKLSTNKAMNSTTASEKYEDTPTVDGFEYKGIVERYFYSEYAYQFDLSQLADSSGNKATLTVTISASDTVVVFPELYRPSASAGHAKVTMATYIPIEKDLVSGLDDLTTVSVQMSAGDTITCTVEMYGTDFSGGVPQFYIVERTDPNVQKKTNITYSIGKVSKVIGYEGGAVGGFAKSELNEWLQTTVKPLMPEALRVGLKKMRLIQNSLKSGKELPYYEFVENDWLETDLFIPSSEEILGNSEGNTKGVDFDLINTTYRKKGNTSSSNMYWCRDVYKQSSANPSLNQFAVVSGYSSSIANISKSGTNCTSALPVYICFCT